MVGARSSDDQRLRRATPQLDGPPRATGGGVSVMVGPSLHARATGGGKGRPANRCRDPGWRVMRRSRRGCSTRYCGLRGHPPPGGAGTLPPGRGRCRDLATVTGDRVTRRKLDTRSDAPTHVERTIRPAVCACTQPSGPGRASCQQPNRPVRRGGTLSYGTSGSLPSRLGGSFTLAGTRSSGRRGWAGTIYSASNRGAFPVRADPIREDR